MQYSINSAHDGSIIVKAYADGGALLYGATFVVTDHVIAFFQNNTSPNTAIGSTPVSWKNTGTKASIPEIVSFLCDAGYALYHE